MSDATQASAGGSAVTRLGRRCGTHPEASAGSGAGGLRACICTDSSGRSAEGATAAAALSSAEAEAAAAWMLAGAAQAAAWVLARAEVQGFIY